MARPTPEEYERFKQQILKLNGTIAPLLDSSPKAADDDDDASPPSRPSSSSNGTTGSKILASLELYVPKADAVPAPPLVDVPQQSRTPQPAASITTKPPSPAKNGRVMETNGTKSSTLAPNAVPFTPRPPRQAPTVAATFGADTISASESISKDSPRQTIVVPEPHKKTAARKSVPPIDERKKMTLWFKVPELYKPKVGQDRPNLTLRELKFFHRAVKQLLGVNKTKSLESPSPKMESPDIGPLESEYIGSEVLEANPHELKLVKSEVLERKVIDSHGVVPEGIDMKVIGSNGIAPEVTDSNVSGSNVVDEKLVEVKAVDENPNNEKAVDKKTLEANAVDKKAAGSKVLNEKVIEEEAVNKKAVNAKDVIKKELDENDVIKKEFDEKLAVPNAPDPGVRTCSCDTHFTVSRLKSVEEELLYVGEQLTLLMESEERRRFLGTSCIKAPFMVQVHAGKRTIHVQINVGLTIATVIRRIRVAAGILSAESLNPRLAVDGKEVGHMMLVGEAGIMAESHLELRVGFPGVQKEAESAR